MKIKILKRETKAIKTFEKKEWKIANLEHFGRDVNWEKEEYKLVARDTQNNILGSLGLKIKAKVAYIKTLLVAKDARRQGIGKNLVLEAEKISRKAGTHKIYLETGDSWEAVEFYKSLGYKITNAIKKHYFGQDFVIFTKYFGI